MPKYKTSILLVTYVVRLAKVKLALGAVCVCIGTLYGIEDMAASCKEVTVIYIYIYIYTHTHTHTHRVSQNRCNLLI